MFNTASELLKLCEERNATIYDIVIEKEMDATGLSKQELMDKMQETLEVMKSSATAGLNTPLMSNTGITGGNSKRVEDYRKKGKTLTGEFVNSAMAMALSTSEVNASMGRICAAPTAGASGILPSTILSARDKLNLSDEMLLNGLYTSAGVGQIVARIATVSGAEGGCQAECGVAAAMGAAAIVEMAGGSPQQALNAAGFALANVLGLVCDPIGGLVEFPCNLRNASGVINGLISADMALAGVQAPIPFDEVVEAMYKVGKALPETLRETALGGLAATPTARELTKHITNPN